jgi:hypothetical protein
MRLYKIEEHANLVKDMDSKAVLNTNVAALMEYKKKQEMQKDIDSLKSDIGEIKDMLNKMFSMLGK